MDFYSYFLLKLTAIQFSQVSDYSIIFTNVRQLSISTQMTVLGFQRNLPIFVYWSQMCFLFKFSDFQEYLLLFGHTSISESNPPQQTFQVMVQAQSGFSKRKGHA